MRAFIAIDLDPGLKEAIQALVRSLRSERADIRWVRPAGMHLTLKFLGPVEKDRVARIGPLMSEVARGRRPFALRLAGTGAFPDERRPRVLWAGFAAEPELMDLQADLDRALAGEGFKPDDRAFMPHLTLGRVKGPKGIAGVVAELGRHRDRPLGDMTVRSMALFESILRPEGAEYRIVNEARLT
ncbi:MAG: RNA 2',3'-cyclic phosphodiesterase [Candidatus Aminicenantes bacterium]|nr:RNA 2',3'-cyclic phosphodiesterase [Candidatus Aminicenantes bacterium]